MDSDTELQVCLVLKAKSASMVRASPDWSSDNPEKEVGSFSRTLELGRLQLHVCVDGGNGNLALPALLGSIHKEHCVKMETKAHVMHLSQGNPKTL